MTRFNPHICVDLDGTLAHYDTWRGPEHIGPPVPAMLARVRAWLAAGTEVRIFTARMSIPEQAETTRQAVHLWLAEQGLPALEVTCVKDLGCLEIWDDRAVGVVANTGRAVGCGRCA